MELHELDPDSAEYGFALASAAVVDFGNLTASADGSFYTYETTTLGDRLGLCSDERFVDQPSLAGCSATLVAPDIIATAGHCVIGKAETASASWFDCGHLAFVFDFSLADPDAELSELDADSVYRCDQILAAENSSEWASNREHDYALIRLDRPVVEREPVAVRGGPGITADEAIVTIGHPSGLPQKIAYGITRDKIDGRPYDGFAYEAELLGGGSGGGVFDLASGTLMGMPSHYNGANYRYDPARDCNELAICGVNTGCSSLPGAYDTVTMLERIPTEVAALLDARAPVRP
ncbi:MAG: serine protease [Deltaproteobacteria bacterium]|nr:serine protease [Deltaproteobacteria bacterium]